MAPNNESDAKGYNSKLVKNKKEEIWNRKRKMSFTQRKLS